MSADGVSAPANSRRLWGGLKMGWRSYAVALSATILTVYGHLLLAPWIGDRPMLVLFLLPVLLSAFLGGLGPGLLATGIAAFCTGYFLVPSRGSFAFDRPVDSTQWLVFVYVGVTVSALIESLHRARRSAASEVSADLDRLQIERKVQAGFSFALVCLGVIGTMSYLGVQRQAAAAAQVEYSEEVIGGLRLLLSSVTDAETAERGFIITGNPDFLAPHEMARDQIASCLILLGKLTVDDAAQKHRLAALGPLMDERLNVSAQNVNLRRTFGFDEAQSAVASGRGKQIHDHIRAVVAEMITAQEGTLKLRSGQARAVLITTQAVIIVGSALALGVAVMALYIIGDDFTRSRRASAELRMAHDQLEARVLERTARLEETNQKLKEGKVRYRDLVRLSPQAIFLNRGGRIDFINEAGLRFFRANHESDILGRSPYDFIHPDFHAIVRGRIEQMLERPQRVPVIYQRMILLDGAVIDAEVAAASYEESGRLVIQVSCQDITERKQVGLVAARLAAIVECSEDAIVGKTTEGIITSWNRGAENVFGFLAGEMIGASITRIIPPEQQGEEEEILRKIVRGEAVHHLETMRLRKDGERLNISVTISPIKDADGRVVGVSKIARDITARKQADAALREKDIQLHLADRRLADIVHGMTEACFALDANWRFVFVNKRCETLLRHSREEMLGRAIWDVFHTLVGTPMEANYRRAMRDRVAVVFEALSPVAGRWLDIRLFPTGDGLSAFLLDIDVRKHSEIALVASEQRFRTTLDNLMEGCQIMGRDWAYIYINEAAARHNRRPASGMIGRTIMECFPGIETTEVYSVMRDCMAGSPARYMENEFTYPDGVRAWFYLIIQPVPEGVFTLSMDVTERKLAERRLATQGTVSRILAAAATLEEAAPLILEAIADYEGWDFGAIWLPDDEAGVLRCRALWSRPGLAAAEVIIQTRNLSFARGQGLPGRIWDSGEAQVVPDVALDPGDLRAPLATKAGLRGAIGFPLLESGRVTGVVDFIARESCAPDEKLTEVFRLIGGQIGLFIQRRQAEEQVRTINAELENRVLVRTIELESANRELEAFSYSVSHDLRAPLRAVDGFSLALIEDCDATLTEQGRHYLGTIRLETRRMGQLIDDLLAFSRLSRVTMKKQGIDMAAQVTVVWNDLIGQYPNRDATLLLGDIPPCRGDHSLMRQVWVNLLANALKYTGCKPAAVVEVGCRREAGNMIYFVKDNGAGFDMRYVHRLFGVFQRLHRADEYEGTGVGLAIAQRIVHRHGGRIWAEGTINAGATFSFTLNEPPRAREPTQQHPG